jgi:hypothetical protein
LETADGDELDGVIVGSCLAGTAVKTDDWNGYNGVGRRHGRVHRMVDHSGSKVHSALDSDVDGVREARCNAMEGL